MVVNVKPQIIEKHEVQVVNGEPAHSGERGGVSLMSTRQLEGLQEIDKGRRGRNCKKCQHPDDVGVD